MTFHDVIDESAADPQAGRRIIAIDLDGTLLRSDSLIESILKLIARNPVNLFQILLWLSRGKIALKDNLCRHVQLDIATLPYNDRILDWAREQKRHGAYLVLATASHYVTAESVAKHLELFDEVIASDATCNLKGDAKRDELNARFGDGGYEYLGNDYVDLSVWASASKAHVVDPGRRLLNRIADQAVIGETFRSSHGTWPTLFRAIRIHQWAKNLLLFVPLASAHQVTNLPLLLNGVVAFILFGLISSSVYLLNDLLDLEDDRHHANKKLRPLAAGQLSHTAAIISIPLVVITTLAVALALLPPAFAGVLLIYLALTLAYTLWLKRRVLIDVVILAILYTVRILAGVAAFELVATFWMLAFSVFLFLSLAFLKRYAELVAMRKNQIEEHKRGRSYEANDFELLVSLGSSSGYVSVLVLALYIQESMTRVMYSRPEFVWFSCLLLLYWISRAWIIAHRGHMHTDPVVFALKDRVSRLVGILFIATFVAAI